MPRCSRSLFAFGLLAAALLTACTEAPPATGGTASAEAPPAEPIPAAPTVAELSIDALRERAASHLKANRLYGPAGDNAVEDYLALRERLPAGQADIDLALVDLAPYLVIATEQATTALQFDEAERLLALLDRVDVTAPALPRLREGLAVAKSDDERRREAERLQADETQRLAALAAEAAASRPNPTPAPTASRPTAASPPAPARTPSAPTPTPAAPTAPTRPLPTAPAAAPPTAAPIASRALITRVQPKFPESALRRRLSGEVELLLFVGPSGRIDRVDVERSSPPGVFDREAVMAARRWRYAEAAESSTVRVTLTFKQP